MNDPTQSGRGKATHGERLRTILDRANVPLTEGMLADGVRIGAVFGPDHIHGKLNGGEAYLWIREDGAWKAMMETLGRREEVSIDITPVPRLPDLFDRATFLLCLDELERRTGPRTYQVDRLRAWSSWMGARGLTQVHLAELLEHTARGPQSLIR